MTCWRFAERLRPEALARALIVGFMVGSKVPIIEAAEPPKKEPTERERPSQGPVAESLQWASPRSPRPRSGTSEDPTPQRGLASGPPDRGLVAQIARTHVAAYRTLYQKGRYDRSSALTADNRDRRRSEPDITNPGADLANFPNSAFTLPEGRAYIEFSPATWYGGAPNAAPQFNTQFLLRYGVTDDIEARIFGNGASWKGGRASADGFSPIAFDIKVHLLDEDSALSLPAVGFEAYVQTELLGSAGFDQGTTGGFTLNFDQSLPWDVDLEYNLGSSQILQPQSDSIWQFNFQWALQKDLVDGELAVFVHGFWNDMTLPRLPRVRAPDQAAARSGRGNPNQAGAVGGGALWTINSQLVLWFQASGGITHYSPSVISDVGLAVAF